MRSIMICGSLFALLSVYSCKQKSTGCARFHTGKFKYHGSFSKQNYIVERNDSVQTELVVETGAVLRFNIQWPEPCTYELHFIGLDKVGKDSSILKQRFPIIRTKIISMTDDYYVYRTGTSITGPELSDTMRVAD